MIDTDRLWRLKFKHGYYKKTLGDYIRVIPSYKTIVLLQQRNCTFRQISSTEWAVMGRYNPFHEDDRIEVEIYTVDPHFFEVTDWDRCGDQQSYKLEITGENGVVTKSMLPGEIINANTGMIFKLCFLPGKLLDSVYQCITTVQFESFTKYWEYLLIPRKDLTMQRQLCIEDKDDKVHFLTMKSILFMDNVCFCCRSTEKIPLSESYDLQLALYEYMRFGKKKLLCAQMPFPTPGMYITESDDTIRHIFYL